MIQNKKIGKRDIERAWERAIMDGPHAMKDLNRLYEIGIKDRRVRGLLLKAQKSVKYALLGRNGGGFV